MKAAFGAAATMVPMVAAALKPMRKEDRRMRRPAAPRTSYCAVLPTAQGSAIRQPTLPACWTATVGANTPCSEDTIATRLGQKGEGDFFGVWDGHGGSAASRFAADALLEHAAGFLLAGSAADSALHEAHRETEDSLRELCWQLCSAQGQWRMAAVGACSLVVHLSQDRAKVTIANAGDCRAVLGVERGIGVYAAKPLSRDHNSREKEEQIRVAAEHPGEPDILHRASPSAWYLKQRLQPTRSLGDFYMKEARFNSDSLGRVKINSKYTPPYVHWQPELKTHEISGGDSFIILGTDGLWDELGNQQAVEIVAWAIHSRRDPAEELLHEAMRHAAAQEGLTLEQLDVIAPRTGTSPTAPAPVRKPNTHLVRRRHVHDDISVIVIRLDGCRRPSEDVPLADVRPHARL
eukprot:TRINITY_DN18902_c0_g1_i1.p1 TRINITY_DN18902_c0_g1~~TRINITY_DN18902_c0_g1_i1.p1  ORF type:complete len:406 (+),score=75.64 TRINITY_DN18902_c0_g1_i1:127-1344(+)